MNVAVIVPALAIMQIACNRDVPNRVEVSGYPIIGIEGGGGLTNLEFQFASCQNKDTPPSVRRIAIYRAGGGPRGESPLCKTWVRPRDITLDTVSRWKYGDTPQGWTMSTKCEPLSAGEFDVHVSGSGSGVRRFAISTDMQFKWIWGPCN
jgi:hypothetical protein